MAPSWLSDGVLVAIIAAAAAVAGSVGQALSSRGSTRSQHETAVLEVMRAEIAGLWARSQSQADRITALENTVEAERARSWMALSYIRRLTTHAMLLSEMVPDPPGPPPIPDPPAEIADDLSGSD